MIQVVLELDPVHFFYSLIHITIFESAFRNKSHKAFKLHTLTEFTILAIAKCQLFFCKSPISNDFRTKLISLNVLTDVNLVMVKLKGFLILQGKWKIL